MVRIFFFLIIISYNLNAQITLDITDLPNAGDVQLSYRVDSIEGLNLSPGDSGANQVWFFDYLNFWGGNPTAALDSVRYTNPDSLQLFPLANMAMMSHCYWVHNWITHVISEVCYRDYFIKDSTGLFFYGTSYPNNHILNNYRNVFPIIQYGQTKIDSSRNVFPISADSVFVTSTIDTNIADSWGEVVTLVESYFAIRVHTIETVWDSLYVNGVGEQISFSPNNYYYRWFTKGLGFPVMQISKGILDGRSDYQHAKFSYLKRSNSISEIKHNFNFINISPNPINDYGYITINNKNTNSKVLIEIYNLTGNIIKAISTNSNKIKISRDNIPSGIYFIKVICDNNVYKVFKIIFS